MSQLQVTGEAKIRDLQGPVVSNSGVISALDGDASQYVRGDGTLADFPTSTGGGSSVSYYLNSSVSQGTIGGVAYRQLGKTPIAGAGTDIVISSNGYVASYITDANDPALLEVPAGNFNCEFYFSVNNNTGNPFTYAEVYKYDGTTFTLIGTSVGVPEYINQGTVINPYYFAVPVAQSVLTVTDRIAIRIYVNVDGRTVTLHTENNHLCQVVTTFSKGLISLNNLTRQNQFFGTGTDGTDFNISSVTATHTFNLPVASATNTGKLSSTDWSTFNGKVPYTGANASVDLGIYNLSASLIDPKQIILKKDTILGGSISIETGSGFSWFGSNDTILLASGASNTLSLRSIVSSVLRTAILDFSTISAATSRTFTLPDITGTLALLEGSQTFTGLKTFGDSIQAGYGISLYNGIGTGALVSATYTGFYAAKSGTYTNVTFAHDGDPFFSRLKLLNNATYDYTFPASSGTIALTSNLSSYVPYSGATTSLDLGSNSLSAGISISINGTTNGGYLGFKQFASATNGLSGYTSIYALSTDTLGIQYSQGGGIIKGVYLSSSLISNNTINTYSFPNASGTLALTSDLSGYVTLATAQTISGAKTFSAATKLDASLLLKDGATISTTSGYGALTFVKSSAQSSLYLTSDTGFTSALNFVNTSSYNYTFPAATGTIALTSNLSAYVPYSGATSDVNLGVYSITSNLQTNRGVVVNDSSGTANALNLKTATSGQSISGAGYVSLVSSTVNYLSIFFGNSTVVADFNASILSARRTYTLPDATGTIALTSNLSGYLPLTGGTLTGALSGTSATFSSTLQVDGNASMGAEMYRPLTSSYLRLNGGGSGVDGATVLMFGSTHPTAAGRLNLSAVGSGSIIFSADGATRLTIASTGAATFSSSVTADGVGFIGVIPSYTNNFVSFSHTARSGAGDYSFLSSNDGTTIVNAKTGKTIDLRINNSNAMTITSGGNVGIGTTTPATFRLSVAGDGNVVAVSSSNNSLSLALGYQGTMHGYLGGISSRLEGYSNNGGYVYLSSSSTWIPASDVKRKRNFETYSLGLDAILGLKPKRYNMDFQDDGDEKQVGLIAQEVKEHIPQAFEQSEDFIGINYNVIIVTLVNAIQELKAEIDELKNK